MLKPPALVNPSRNPLLPQPRQIGRMEHAYLNPVRAVFGYQRRQQ